MTKISLLRLNHIDNTYTHTMDFTSKTTRDTYFNSKVLKTFDINCRDDVLINTITLPINHSEINNLNYLFFNNEKNERYYFFILSHTHKTNNTTEIQIQLDVFTTYWNDITLKESFVDRCHQNRWNGNTPTTNTIDEGFPLNEYELEATQTICTYNDGLIISSTQPLGVCQGFKLPGIGGGGTGGSCEGDINAGILSSKGFRFIKGYEAFAPYAYDDGFGYMTIAYGVTQHGEPDTYNQLVSMQPVPEETAAKISYQLKIDNYGLKIKDQFLKIYSNTDINKFDAVVSFVFNLGVGMMNDGNSFYEALKTKDETTIRTQWLKYINANGQPVEGLRLRREAELKIFFTGLYEFRQIPLLDANGSIIGYIEENRGDGWLPTCDGTGTGKKVTNELGEWTIPTTGEITATYPTYPSGSAHTGTDIANTTDTPIYAGRAGTAETKELTTSYGKHVIITHVDGSKSYYAHMNSITITNGSNVAEGQQVGKMGTTGNSTGVHLHWEIRKPGGTNIQPMPGYKVGDII